MHIPALLSGITPLFYYLPLFFYQILEVIGCNTQQISRLLSGISVKDQSD